MHILVVCLPDVPPSHACPSEECLFKISSNEWVSHDLQYGFLFLKKTLHRARHQFHNMSSSQHETLDLRRPPVFKKLRLSAEIVTMTTESPGPERRIKGMSIRPHPLITAPSSSFLFVLHPLSWTPAAANCNGAQAAEVSTLGGVLR